MYGIENGSNPAPKWGYLVIGLATFLFVATLFAGVLFVIYDVS
jgi:hypothetical protein